MDHNHEEKIVKTDGTCGGCNRLSVAVDSVLAKRTLVATETGFEFDPPLDGQELVDAVTTHNHEKGAKLRAVCPVCSRTSQKARK